MCVCVYIYVYEQLHDGAAGLPPKKDTVGSNPLLAGRANQKIEVHITDTKFTATSSFFPRSNYTHTHLCSICT